jgi:uncharacterized coiled-coil protein SlyX
LLINGKSSAVRYGAVNAMLLNEFLKEHRKVEAQEVTIAEVKSTAAKQAMTIEQQQKEIQALTAALKEQAAQIQKATSLGHRLLLGVWWRTIGLLSA